jgi:hypothetical protein
LDFVRGDSDIVLAKNVKLIAQVVAMCINNPERSPFGIHG